MRPLPNWEVSDLVPVLLVERVDERLFRNIALFQIAGKGLLKSPEGRAAAERCRLAAAAPSLARALVATCLALRSYAYGNASTELAASMADHGEALLAAMGIDMMEAARD